MTSRVVVFSVLVLAAVLLAACGPGREQDPPAGVDRVVVSTSGSADLAFRSEPSPPRTGQNAFEVTVRDEDGDPVTDATVTVEFYMPAMPEVNMPEMRDTAMLTHESGGVYRGTGQVVMAGDWEVTVTATRHGEEIGRRTLEVTARQ